MTSIVNGDSHREVVDLPSEFVEQYCLVDNAVQYETEQII